MSISVTQSQIKTYKACKRKYMFAYVEQLKPVETPEAMVVGASYHAKIESLLKYGFFECTGDKTDAMAFAFEKYIMPTIGSVKLVESVFECELEDGIKLIGKFDAIAESGIPIEHKTCSGPINEDYLFGLNWDDQVSAYLIATGKTKVKYTVCQKPTIRQKQNETVEDYINRCVAWYDENTEQKIRVFEVVRSEAELADKKKEFAEIAKEMERCKCYYTNPSYCTAWGRRCEFASICLDYDPKFIPIQFVKKTRKNEELEEQTK